MSLWQKKCESKLGFDPISYFGGIPFGDDENNLKNIKKDPRFSGKYFLKLYN
jgi:hypothetical protein